MASVDEQSDPGPSRMPWLVRAGRALTADLPNPLATVAQVGVEDLRSHRLAERALGFCLQARQRRHTLLVGPATLASHRRQLVPGDPRQVLHVRSQGFR